MSDQSSPHVMDEQEVVDLMSMSRTAEDWRDNCDYVKMCFGGDYPTFWWQAIIQSGLADSILSRWGASTKLTVTFFGETENQS